MLNAREFLKVWQKFCDPVVGSVAAQGARVVIEMPNGEMHDLKEILLAQNNIVGHETHRIIIRTEPLKVAAKTKFTKSATVLET
jgi:hypothetical protein|tara:strand:+ start:300 stop:551 length:252 start_codon:yes stop_codon:yes gene_type:complete